MPSSRTDFQASHRTPRRRGTEPCVIAAAIAGTTITTTTGTTGVVRVLVRG